jgi:hypothetical protein
LSLLLSRFQRDAILFGLNYKTKKTSNKKLLV